MNKKLKKTGGAIEKAILYNKYVLYFIFLITLGYLFILLMLNDFYTFFIFILIGLLTSFFSKNMVVILSLAMSVSFILKYGTKIRPEGFQEGAVDASGNIIDASGNPITTTTNPTTTTTNPTTNPTTTTTDPTTITTDPTSSTTVTQDNQMPTLSPQESANLLTHITTALNKV